MVRFTVLIAVALIALTGLTLAPSERADAAPGDVTISGHGYGHGRGMSQWGAYGYATQYGRTYDQILRHYYSNTTFGDLGNPIITVRLTALDNRAPEVTSSVDFTAANLPVAGGSSAQIARNPDGSWQLTTRNTCGGAITWTGRVSDTGFRTLVQPTGLRDMLTTCGPEVRTYRGHLGVIWDGSGLRTVNYVLMEDYLRGVLPRESPSSWGDAAGGRGIQALMAQAVAARSYGWAENRASYAKTCDTTSCQVYGGAGLNWQVIEDRRAHNAIDWTAGQILLRANGGVARAEFSSSSGGYTAGGEFPAVVDEGDAVSPNYNWSVTIPGATIAAAFGVGSLRSVSVLTRNGLGADGGRVLTVRIDGSSRSVTVTGNQFRSALGLKSDWFSVGSSVPGADRVDASPVGVSAVRAATGQMTAFVRGTDSVVYFRTSLSSGEWAGWSAVPDGTLVGAPMAISYGNAIDLVGRGMDGRYWGNFATLDGQGRPANWRGWYPLPGGGVFSSAPALASAGQNLLTILGRGLDGALWQMNWAGNRWTNWASAGGTLLSAPTVQARTSGGRAGYVVYALAPNSRVMYRSVGADAPGPTSAWGQSDYYSRLGPQTDPLDAAATPGVVLTSTSPDSIVGLTNTLTGTTTSLGGAITSTASMVLLQDNTRYVFARGTDGALWVSFWTPAGGPAYRWWSLGGTLG